MSSLMKIGELAKQTGLSIRTLHYYDEVELLSPSHRTDVGHRLYSEQDIIRLQRILSLRQLGFSLAEIRECLASPDYALPKVIDLHCARVREQMALLRTLLKRLSAIANELQTTQSVAVENLIEAMETITMSEQYFTPEQQAILEARFQESEAEWQEMINLAHSEMRQDSGFSTVKMQAVASYWQRMMKSLIGGDAQMYESFMKIYQNEGGEAASWGTTDTATFDYILKAVAFASLTEDLQVHISEQNYTPSAIAAMHLGQDAIRELNMDVFGTEGMLLGLITEGTSIAAQILTAAGVTFKAAQQYIVQIVGSRPKPPIEIPTPPHLPFAYRAKRVLELAREQAEEASQPQSTPEHLLLGILQETEEIEVAGHQAGVAALVLRNGFGIDLAHLEQQLRTAKS